MNKADEVFNKIMNLPMPELLKLCASALEEKMEAKRLDTLLMILEMRLSKQRMLNKLGVSNVNKEAADE